MMPRDPGAEVHFPRSWMWLLAIVGTIVLVGGCALHVDQRHDGMPALQVLAGVAIFAGLVGSLLGWLSLFIEMIRPTSERPAPVAVPEARVVHEHHDRR